MLRNVALASSVLRRLVASASRHTLLSPQMSAAFISVPSLPELPACLSPVHQLLFPALLSQARGFARESRPPAPSEDDDADFSEEEPDFSGADFDDKYLSEGEGVFDSEDGDDEEDQLE